MKKVIALFCLFVFCTPIVEATNFVSVKLPRGVEVDIPKEWWLLNAEHRQMIETSLEAAWDLSGLDLPTGTDAMLIAANSMPRTTYAAIGVRSTTPASGPPSEVSNYTEEDLRAYETELRDMIKKMLSVQGGELLSFSSVRRETISGYPALVAQYRRSGTKGPVVVKLIQISTPSQDLNVNLSYRE